MTGIYKITRPDGSVEVTNVPSGEGTIRPWKPGLAVKDQPAEGQAGEEPSSDAELAKTLIKEAQKRGPKLVDYLDYLDYLRHHSFDFERVMEKLRIEDPLVHHKLLKYPQFRPLHQTAMGSTGTHLMEAGVNMAVGKWGGSVEKWLEGTVKDMMKRDRWGAHAEVLGAKATTLPTKAPTYSNSAAGQYAKVQDAKTAAAAKLAAKELEASSTLLRGSVGTAIGRVGGVGIDFLIAPLNPENAVSTTNILMRDRIRRLTRRNPAFDIDTAVHELALSLLSQGRYAELDTLLKQHE